MDQMHCFDAMYRDPAPLIRWARRTPGFTPVVLRVPGGRNEVTAALPRARVEPTAACHADMPRANGWPLLMDAPAPIV